MMSNSICVLHTLNGLRPGSCKRDLDPNSGITTAIPCCLRRERINDFAVIGLIKDSGYGGGRGRVTVVLAGVACFGSLDVACCGSLPKGGVGGEA